MTFAAAQSPSVGTRVTNGTSCTAAYGANVTANNLLVAFVARNNAATVGRVSDGVNKWKQAGETTYLPGGFGSGPYAVDVWICEHVTAAAGGTKPTVTAQLVAYPPVAIVGMQMVLCEYSGATGYELIDAEASNNGTTTSLSIATNYATSEAHDLVVSIVAGNMSAATVPSGWTSITAQPTQGFWVAELLDSGASTGVQTAAWTGLTGGTQNCGIVLAFRPTGNSSGPTVLQTMMLEPALGGSPSSTLTASAALPVNPAAGSTLLLICTAATFFPSGGNQNNWTPSSSYQVTDTAGNTWHKLCEAGPDETNGNNFAIWFCDSATGTGAVTVTMTVFPAVVTPFFLVVELSGCSTPTQLDAFGTTGHGTFDSVSTTTSAAAGDIGISTFDGIVPRQWVPASGWTLLFTDSEGINGFQIEQSTASGILTASVGTPDNGAAAMMVAAVKQQTVGFPGLGV